MGKAKRKLKQGASLGKSLSLAIVLIAGITALVLTLTQTYLVNRYLEQDAKRCLAEHLIALDSQIHFSGLDQRQKFMTIIEKAVNHLDKAFKVEGGFSYQVYGFTFKGEKLKLIGKASYVIPPPKELRNFYKLKKGFVKTQIKGKEYWLVFKPIGNGEVILVVQAGYWNLIGKVIEDFWKISLWISLLIAVITILGSVFLIRKYISIPLKRLTLQGEKVASGDLTPPELIDNRFDELGRLSVVLNKMTQKAKEMVIEAKTSHQRFQELFLDSHDGAFIINENGRIEDINPAAIKIFGYQSLNEMLELKNTEKLFHSPKEREIYLNKLLAQGFVQNFSCVLKRKDNSTFDALISATLGELGESRLGLVRDVTLMRQAEIKLRKSEERHRRLLDNAPDLILRWSQKSGGFDYVSKASEEILGYLPQELIEKPNLLKHSLHPDHKESVTANWREVWGKEPGAGYEQEYKIIHKSGEIRWVDERTVLWSDLDGNSNVLEGILTDITERKQIEQAMIQARNLVENTLSCLPVPVIVLDKDHKIVHWNKSMVELSLLPANRMLGTRNQWQAFYSKPRPILADLILEKDWETFEKYYGHANSNPAKIGDKGINYQGFFENVGGKNRHLFSLAAPIFDNKGEVVSAVQSIFDVTDQKDLEKELTRLSVTDGLTGLYNQRYFYETLERELNSCRRYNHELALVLLDLDHFKNFNDSFGHLSGDKVLETIAKILEEAIRGTDLACRYGGEEFMLIMPHTGDMEALSVAERVRKKIFDYEFELESLTGRNAQKVKARISASFGVATFEEGLSNKDLIKRADHAMYMAKIGGRNKVISYKNSAVQDLPFPKNVLR